MKPKTCFVISPIGAEGTDARKHADDFLDLLVEPALQSFSFTVIRADKIARASTITEDIITLVQQAELCLVDLTFHNPNVFYECGRRHETGRPVILLIRKGDTLPFDVAGIRTIEYDLSDPRTTLNSVKLVQEFIREFERTSYGVAGTGATLSSLADSLARIERLLERSFTTAAPSRGSQLSPKELLTKHPAAAFKLAMDVGDIESAKRTLPRVKKFLSEDAYYQACAVLASTGDEETKTILLNAATTLTQQQQYKALHVCFVGLMDYYTTTASFAKGIEAMSNLIYSIANDEAHSPEERAFALNRLQMMRYQEDQHDEALKDALRVVELCPNDNSYVFNLSMIYEAMGNFAEAAKWCDRFLALKKDPKARHVEHVAGVYRKAGKTKALEALQTKYGSRTNTEEEA